MNDGNKYFLGNKIILYLHNTVEKNSIYLYFVIFVILEENDNSLIVRKTKKQMMFKHMKLWNNGIVHSSFHPGEGEISKSECVCHCILLVKWHNIEPKKRKSELCQKI